VGGGEEKKFQDFIGNRFSKQVSDKAPKPTGREKLPPVI
jgi:hypothetical protein